ncbi:MAG: hypothetical protein JST16_05360 [Bdellovibrionales bacterium]|nr:hypothetical protein [Bdellovibrionales bacterium]
MKKQIQTGDEPWVQSVNDIFQCANDESGAPAICYQTCISRFFPQNRRYALYLSGYVPNNRCFASVLEWPRYDGVLSSYKLYNGAYQTYMRDGVTTGRCSGIDVERPDVDAYHQFSMVTVPSGQLTPHPGGLRVYDVLTLFSDASGQNLLTSYFLTEWSTVEGDLVTPNRYEYLDGSGHATFGQTAGFDCAKRAEITNEVVLSFQPGQ